MSVKIARLAEQTNIFPLYEIENGTRYTLHYKGDRPVEDYLQTQGDSSTSAQKIYQPFNAWWWKTGAACSARQMGCRPNCWAVKARCDPKSSRICLQETISRVEMVYSQDGTKRYHESNHAL